MALLRMIIRRGGLVDEGIGLMVIFIYLLIKEVRFLPNFSSVLLLAILFSKYYELCHRLVNKTVRSMCSFFFRDRSLLKRNDASSLGTSARIMMGHNIYLILII
jgi:hypothetical protein